MNAAGMLFNQFIQSKDGVLQTLNKDAASDQQNVFRRLLSGSRNETGNKAGAQHITKKINNTSELIEMLSGSEDNNDLIEMLLDSDDVNKQMDQAALQAVSKEEVIQMLKELMQNLSGRNGTLTDHNMQIPESVIDKLITKRGDSAEEVNMIKNKDVPLLMHLQTAPQTVSDEKTIQHQFAALFEQVQNLLAQITNQKNISQVAPELLKLLEQWSVLAKKTNQQSGVLSELASTNNEKEQAIWRHLVQSFQKRNQLVMKQQYNTNAKVTSSDVAKWLHHAIQNQAQLDKTTTQQTLTMTSSMPMSKVEQYVIHLNQTNTQPADHQLIEQFQKVMKSSKFMTMQNGTSQLNISLRPENLGDMMIKLTQMNGEMTVKIVVTSAAAKDMLETNMHQLKNMFSPQQVVVEKQEVNSQQTQTNQHEEDGQPMDDHNEQSQSDDSEADDNHSTEEDFELQLQEVLMNEKV
ncbi:flagellar hook-length control protein FliK [Lentibacillus salinarum]|uniref:Flagellar hook-length control protein FliK n=1 Tax=Lentibacillus salinarum TaxID=446820 RepID=A0ABW3ZPR0_9BACI